MASEASAVIVAVRVRPFNHKEDPLTCTITVPNSTTINVIDVGTVLHGASTSSSTAAGGGGSGSSGGGSGGGSGAAMGGGTDGAYGDSTSAPSKHAFAFDKVFWSIAPEVLPLRPPAFLSEALGTGHASVAPSRKSSVLSTSTSTSLATSGGGVTSSPSTASALSTPPPLLSHLAASVAQQLPCLQCPPEYDDQASVYEFIGPKLYEAAMSGFNACLFAYGQTGSGKSYSMIGEHLSSAAALVKKGTVPRTSQGRELGIMPRLSADLFALMRQEREKDESVSFTVEVSFLEIYCEKVRDLLVGVPGGTVANPSTPASTTTTATATSAAPASYFNAASTAGSLRVRQHPSRGPYVEGLSHVRVRDAEGVVKYLVSGLRDRATAGTKMNEHSSRSHAILQLHITKVTVASDEGGVLTKTRTCKVNLVDLAGSERVTQSGVTGDRFEEARNINQSLSTLGRVIQQLSDKQAGKRVIPAYRESVLTWLLSDSLGGNSKTIMLATVAPSAYCYAQTLNTLRFAGVAKRIINVASVNEDRQYQQVIAELRQQIVRLTLQLESGKAAEVHSAEIVSLKAQKEELLRENTALKSREAGVADPQTVLALRKRIAELEDANTQLRSEKDSLQQRMLQTSSSLREELAASRAEALRLHTALSKKEAEAADWQNRYRAAQRPNVGSVSPSVIASAGGPMSAASTPGLGVPVNTGNDVGRPQQTDRSGGANLSMASAHQQQHPDNNITGNNTMFMSAIEASLSGQSTFIAADAGAAQRQQQEELAKLKKQLATLKADLKTAKHALEESKDAARTAQRELVDYRQNYESCQRQLDLLQERMESTTVLLESTQFELARAKQSAEPVASHAQRSAEEAVALASQLAQTRQDYLKEKQGNVQLLLRVSQLEQERGQLKKQAAELQADVAEVELLLLEETETSERYYLRMRYHRTISEGQHNFTSKVVFAAERRGAMAAAAAMSRRGSVPLSSTPSPSHYCDSASPTLRTPRQLAGGQNSPGDGAPLSPSAAEQLLSRSAVATRNSWELMFAQLEYECMSDEAHQRAAIEQESLTSTIRLLSQRARLRQAEVTHLEELLLEARDQLSQSAEQLTFFRAKAAELERRVSDLQEEHLRDADAARESEANLQQLQRRLETVEDQLAEREGNANALIEKLADAQAARDTMKERCGELEAMLDDAQDALAQQQQQMTPSTPTARSTAGSRRDESDGDDGEDGRTRQARQRRTDSVFDVQAVVHLKEKELMAALQDARRLEAQCDAYRDELGAANAMREKENGEHQSREAQLQQQIQLLTEKMEHLQTANKALAAESAAALRDHELRVSQQQAMITTLRRSLEEESRTADESRDAAQQAEARLQCMQEDLSLAQEANEELRQQRRLVEGRYAVVQKELEELRAHYAALEGQLMELRKKEPELYVMLERGLSEDMAAWLDKVKREKASLQKQKQDARQLNTELLAHIRNRNSHLRDVQRQLTEIAETSVNTSATGGGGGGDSIATAAAGPRARGSEGDLADVTDRMTEDSLPSSIHSTPATTPKHTL